MFLWHIVCQNSVNSNPPIRSMWWRTFPKDRRVRSNGSSYMVWFMRRDGNFFITRKLAHLQSKQRCARWKRISWVTFSRLTICRFWSLWWGHFLYLELWKDFWESGYRQRPWLCWPWSSAQPMRFLFWSYRSCLPTCPSSHDPNIARNPLNPIGFWEPPFWSAFLSPRFLSRRIRQRF